MVLFSVLFLSAAHPPLPENFSADAIDYVYFVRYYTIYSILRSYFEQNQ